MKAKDINNVGDFENYPRVSVGEKIHAPVLRSFA